MKSHMLVGVDVDLGGPTVVHCMREPHHVYIGRPSKWGNPFVIGRDGDRDTVIDLYERYLLGTPSLKAALPQLAGRVLGCWCYPKPCHGDVLLRLANTASERDRGQLRTQDWLSLSHWCS